MITLHELLPGASVSVAIYILATLIDKKIPGLGAASYAILIGLVLGNTLFKDRKYEKGTKFCESKLLEYSIVLLGSTLTFKTILDLGIKGVSFILITMTLTISFSYFISRKFGFSKNFSLLMGAGNAICGSSAIASSANVLETNSSETGLAITMVNVTGTILMFLLPLTVVPLFFAGNTLESSALIGGILQSVGQVVGGAAMISPEVVKFATIFKIFRIIMLTFVLLAFSHLKQKSCVQDPMVKDVEKIEKKKIKINVPWYIIGFFMMCVIASFGLFPQKLVSYFKMFSKFFEITALAAIGLRVKYETIKKEGAKSLLAGSTIGVFQIISAVILIKLIF
ncbi:MAG: YeiH family protein [Fusobacteriaceae bacterium]